MKHEGVWYLVEIASFTPNPPQSPLGTASPIARHPPVIDAVLQKASHEIARRDLIELYGDVVYARTKRQMNKRQIKRMVGHREPRPLPSFVRNRRRKR